MMLAGSHLISWAVIRRRISSGICFSLVNKQRVYPSQSNPLCTQRHQGLNVLCWIKGWLGFWEKYCIKCALLNQGLIRILREILHYLLYEIIRCQITTHFHFIYHQESSWSDRLLISIIAQLTDPIKWPNHPLELIGIYVHINTHNKESLTQRCRR